MKKCLFCYKKIENGDFHESCSKKIFNNPIAPLLSYSVETMEELANEIAQNSIAVTGVQPKLSLHLNPATKQQDSRFTIVGLWGNFILKPPIKEYPNMPEVEDCTMHLASLFDISVVPHSLIRLKSGELAYITRRVDRDFKKKAPIHMEDFCQLSEKLTIDKYRGSMESIAKLIKKFSSNSGFDLISFFEITVFSFLTANGDMHLKNFSLLHNNENITLAPAYDLLCTRLFISEKNDPEEMALTLNWKKRKFKLSDFQEFGISCGLSLKQIENSLNKFAKNYHKIESLVRSSFLSESLQNEFLEIIEERAKRLEII